MAPSCQGQPALLVGRIHLEVTEAAAVGVDDETLGQVVKAVARPGAKLTPDAVRDLCAETLAPYKVPERVELRSTPLPRNATGKVMKHALEADTTEIFVEE